MICGMSIDEFYNGDPTLVHIYAAKYKEQRIEENKNAWLQGRYFYMALASILGTMFHDKKSGSKPPEYPQEPFPLFKTEEEIQEEESKKIFNSLNNFLIQYKKNNGGE